VTRRLLPSPLGFLAVAVLVASLGAALLVAFESEERINALAPAVEPIETIVDVRELVTSLPVSVEIEFERPQVLVAGAGLAGTVTKVSDASILRNGAFVLAVDGVDRVLFSSPEPFYRPLKVSDSGADVRRLQTMLTELGFSDAPLEPGVVDFPTLLAIRAFSGYLGANPGGAILDQYFDPAWIVWSSTPEIEVGEYSVEQGAPAPIAGSPIANATPAIGSLIVVDSEGTAVDLVGSWRLDIGNVTLAVRDGLLEDARERILDVFGTEGEAHAGVLRRTSSTRTIVVPSSSVRLDEGGVTCIFQLAGDSYSAVAVQLGEARLSAIEVTEGLTGGESILVNQARILPPGRSCLN